MRYLFVLLLLVGSVYADDLDSTEAARTKTYALLGMDTTGTTNLPTNMLDDYIYFGIQQVNSDLAQYARVDSLATVAGDRYIALDSVVRILDCQYVNNDTTIGIRLINSWDIDTAVMVAQHVKSKEKFPRYAYRFSDSLGLVPTPTIADDTVQVHYIHAIPPGQTSILKIQENNRIGVVYWALMLASMDLGKVEIAAWWEQKYDKFIASRRQ